MSGRMTAVRCAAHPARPAHDRCPTCGRPRCARDAEGAASCALCACPPAGRQPRPVAAALVAAAAVAVPIALLGSALGQEYVGARFLSVVFPALVGVALAAGIAVVAGPVRPRVRPALAAVAVAFAALSALLDFRLTDLPYGRAGRWGPPVLAAAGAAAVATLLLARRAQDRKTISAIPPR